MYNNIMNKNNNDQISQNFYNFVKSSLNFYDTYAKINYNIVKNIYRHEIISKKNLEQIYFYDNNNEILIKGKYQIIGVFDRHTKIFNWGWAISNLNSDLVSYSKELLNYGLNLSKEYIILKYLLTKTDLETKNLLFEELIASLVSYLLKKTNIFHQYIHPENKYKVTLICIE